MANVRKRILQLTALESASLNTSLVGVDGGTTYRIELDTLADAVTARVNILDRDRLSSLESVTSSFETKGRNVISSSSQLTSSYDTRYVVSGSITQTTWDNIANKPDGIVSQSTDLSALNSFTQSQNILNTAFTNGMNARLQTSSFNTYTSSNDTTNTTQNSRLTSLENNSGSYLLKTQTGSFAITGSNVFKGQQIVSGSFTVSISGNAFGVNENPTPNNIFWSYIPNDTNTTSIEPGWIANIETIGTYNVTNVEYDYPFVKITLDDGLLELPYRCNGYFSLALKELKFGTDGVLKISGSLSVSGSITGSTNFNTIVNKPTLISGSSQLTSSYDSRYVLSGSITQTTWDNIANKPTDIISSSAQISALGFTSQSADISALNSFTASQQALNTAFNNGISARLQTSSFNDFSASVDTRINSIVTESGSNLTYLLEAYANVTYTLPGGFTEDPCRYSVVSATENVPSNWFNTSTYTFTPQKAGYWEINAAYDVYRNTEASMAIRKNGSIVASAGSFNAVAQDISKIIYLNGSTDYIDIVNTGGAALQRNQYQQRSWFQAKFVGNISGSTDLPSGLISGSSQLTSSFDTRYLNTGGDNIISGSSQLTSSFDTRYALSASFVSSSNVSSIQTITSASYAAITPVSGTLYIIIG